MPNPLEFTAAKKTSLVSGTNNVGASKALKLPKGVSLASLARGKYRATITATEVLIERYYAGQARAGYGDGWVPEHQWMSVNAVWREQPSGRWIQQRAWIKTL